MVSADQCAVEEVDCDLRIKGFYLDMIPHTGVIQLPIVVVTQKDRSDLLLNVTYKNTTEVPRWMTVDHRHALLIGDYNDFVSNDEFVITASLGLCSDTMEVKDTLKDAMKGITPPSSWYNISHDRILLVICPWLWILNFYLYYHAYRNRWHTMSAHEKEKILIILFGSFSGYCILVLVHYIFL